MTDIIPAAEGWALFVPTGCPGNPYREYPVIAWDVDGDGPAPGMAWGWRVSPGSMLRDPQCNFYSLQDGKWQPQHDAA